MPCHLGGLPGAIAPSCTPPQKVVGIDTSQFGDYECGLWMVRYGDGAGKTVEENSSIFSLIQMR